MLCKLSLRNIRRSVRDYAIYFFTLVIGVSVFYVFNAVSTQAAMMRMKESLNEVVQVLSTAIEALSVFVAVVFGLLIVYANRFLMKRRSREFALYLTLGMGKGKISAILLLETLLIGIGSLLVGLLIGLVSGLFTLIPKVGFVLMILVVILGCAFAVAVEALMYRHFADKYDAMKEAGEI